MSNGQIFTPFSEMDLMPQEEKLEVLPRSKKLTIGIPKETDLNERRTCLTPDAVQVLTDFGYKIIIESGAGGGSFFTDMQYADAGAVISAETRTVFGQNVVLKVNPPTEQEICFLKPNTCLISALQTGLRDRDYFSRLSERKVNAVAYELITDEYKQRPLVSLIGEISGTAAVLYAAELLALSSGLMLGGVAGIRPVEIVIIGAGTIGEFAMKSAIGLGANVRVFDNSLSKLRRLHNLMDSRLSTSIIDPKELGKSLRRADVVIGAYPEVMGVPVVTQDMVLKMKKGSVIIDLMLDQGRTIETSELTTMQSPYIVKHGVVHCGLPNITSRMASTATKAISNFFLPYLLNTDEECSFESRLLQRSEMKNSFYVYRGRFTNKDICTRFDLNYHDINLLMF